MPRLYRVLYDFKAEEEGELTVTAGQTVALKEDDFDGANGWIQVQQTSAPYNAGLVPAEYVQPLPATTLAAAPAAAATPGPEHVPASPASTVYPGHSASQFSSPAQPSSAAALAQSSLADSYLGRTGGGGGGGGFGGYSYAGAAAAASPASTVSHSLLGGPSAAVADEFVAVFATHEEWFRAASQKRSEIYKGLAGEANDILRSLSEAEARSGAVLQRLEQLDALLSEEKARWQGRTSGAPFSAAASAGVGLNASFAGTAAAQ